MIYNRALLHLSSVLLHGLHSALVGHHLVIRGLLLRGALVLRELPEPTGQRASKSALIVELVLANSSAALFSLFFQLISSSCIKILLSFKEGRESIMQKEKNNNTALIFAADFKESEYVTEILKYDEGIQTIDWKDNTGDTADESSFFP